MIRTPLHRLLSPRSIAVVGASASPEQAGHELLRNMSIFPGPVFAVSRCASDILDCPTYPSLAAIGEPIDLVAICLPPEACIAGLRDAASVKAGAVLIAGDVSEHGRTAPTQRAEILNICRQSGIRLLGPNTAGFANTCDRVAASVWPGTCELLSGKISIVAQGFDIHITVAAKLRMLGCGVQFAIGLGDSTDITVVEIVDYLAHDDETEVIALHLEDIPTGRVLFEAISRAAPRKPVVTVAVGRTDVGALAGLTLGHRIDSFALERAALRQAGAVVVDSINDLVDAAITLSCGRIPPSSDPGLGVLAERSGPGLCVLEELRAAGVRITQFDSASVAEIEAQRSPVAHMHNPMDAARRAARFGDVVHSVADDPSVDALLMFINDDSKSDSLVDQMAIAKATIEKPIVVGCCGSFERTARDCGALINLQVPAFCGPERAAGAARALIEDAKGCSRIERRAGLQAPHRRSLLGSGVPDELDAKSLLLDYDIPVPRALRCTTRADAVDAFKGFAKPIVVKVLDASIRHKAELGGVHLDVSSEDQFLMALDRIDGIKTSTRSGYLLEEMAKPGTDLVISGINDASFGPTVMVGLDDAPTEAVRNNVIRLAPLAYDEALEMLSILGAQSVLNGRCGVSVADRSAIAHAIVKTGEIMCAHAEIREMNIDPFRAFRRGGAALDCVVVLAQPGAHPAETA